MKVTIYNNQKARKIETKTLNNIKEAVKLCAKLEAFPYVCEVYITLTDNEAIQQYNKDYRQIDKPTDVLSFPLIQYNNREPQVMPGDIDPETNRLSLGDIIISVEKAEEQAQNYGHSFEREIVFLAVHGMLHLLGYDHMDEEEEKIMFGKQKAVLDEIGLKRE
ncbi:MAG: rRNA maturation RNase YbeY [Clostridiaceae bacterium]|nr:rRNA maturation RNase YbeY [Clostridiaceae bacterium]